MQPAVGRTVSETATTLCGSYRDLLSVGRSVGSKQAGSLDGRSWEDGWMDAVEYETTMHSANWKLFGLICKGPYCR